MAFFSEFFFSPLIGKPVYTIDEDYYGDLRDFIVKRQNGNFTVTKIRVRPARPAPHKRMIIPWQDVHSFEADPVSIKLKKRLEDITSVEYDDSELRLKRDLLDQQIIDTAEHRVVRVNDLKMVVVKDELFMVAADIGYRGLLRRIGFEQWALSFATIFRKTLPNTLLPSKYIDPFPARIRHDITLTVAQEELKKMHPADLADIVEDLDQFERISVLQTLPVETMAKTLAELEPEVRKQLLNLLKDDTVTKILERLAPDAATDIVSELPKRRMQHVLNTMKISEAEQIRDLLQFKENTAGSIMTTNFVSFPTSSTAGHALDELRKKGAQAEQIFYLYLVDDAGALKGVISLRDIIFVEASTPLETLIKREPIFVKSREHINDVVEKFAKYNLIVMPVVGNKGRLRGVITVDDVLPLLQENSE